MLIILETFILEMLMLFSGVHIYRHVIKRTECQFSTCVQCLFSVWASESKFGASFYMSENQNDRI